MIGNKLEQSIISVFQEDLSSTFSINKVSKALNKSYPIINKKSNFFLKEGVLKKMDIGRSYQCFLNMQNDKTRVLMALNEINTKEALLQKNKDMEIVIDEITQLSKKFQIDTVLLYKKTLICIMQDVSRKNEILEQSTLTRDYTLLFFTRKSFQERFLEDKDLQKYHVLLHNVDIYLNILSEVSEKFLINSLMLKNDVKLVESKNKKDNTDGKKVKRK
jgi:hypothetical protein